MNIVTTYYRQRFGPDTFLTEVSHFFYSTLGVLAAVIVLGERLFSDTNPASLEEFMQIGLNVLIALAVSSFIGMILWTVSWFVEDLHRRYEVDDFKRLEINAMIALGGTFFCGSISRVLVFFIEKNVGLTFYIFFVFLFTYSALIFLFLPDIPQNYIMNDAEKHISHKKLISILVECGVCLLQYSELKRPIVLEECGHTICSTCVDELVKKNNRKFLFCPFCEAITVVNGSAWMLTTNHAVLDVVKELKTK